MEIPVLVEKLNRDGTFRRVINNPLAQFGPPARNYLGATLFPERQVKQNAYTEQGIRYRTIIANDGTRYSPVQRKSGILSGSFDVRLGHSDTGNEFTAQDYDALLDLLANIGNDATPPMTAIGNLIRWSDVTLTLPLVEKNELSIWQALVDAQVPRTGDNGYNETVQLSDPTGHRVNSGDWSDDEYDPYDDILAMADLITSKGYTVSRIITTRPVVTLLGKNALIRTRVGRLSTIGGTVVGLPGRASRAEINALFSEDELPPMEEYNLQYRTSTSSGFFLARDAFVMLATTGVEETLDFGDQQVIPLQDTLGYMAIGRPAGQTVPGRRERIAFYDDKPPRIDGQAWQASFPVLLEPEAVGVLKNIPID